MSLGCVSWSRASKSAARSVRSAANGARQGDGAARRCRSRCRRRRPSRRCGQGRFPRRPRAPRQAAQSTSASRSGSRGRSAPSRGGEIEYSRPSRPTAVIVSRERASPRAAVVAPFPSAAPQYPLRSPIWGSSPLVAAATYTRRPSCAARRISPAIPRRASSPWATTARRPAGSARPLRSSRASQGSWSSS